MRWKDWVEYDDNEEIENIIRENETLLLLLIIFYWSRQARLNLVTINKISTLIYLFIFFRSSLSCGDDDY